MIEGEGKYGTWAIVGDAPGEEELRQERPFVGKAGRELDRFLSLNEIRRRDGYLTLLSDYTVKELRVVKPRIIVPLGPAATKFVMGDESNLDAVHGMPQRPREELRDWGGVVLPVYSPLTASYFPDILHHVYADFAKFAAAVRKEVNLEPIVDKHPDPIYQDLSLVIRPEKMLEEVLSWGDDVALDTEGVPSNPWSFQISTIPGHALVVCTNTGVFDLALKALRKHFAKKGGVAVFHNALYDIEMLTAMWLDLLEMEVPLFDSMVAAYIMCTEPQGLKNLARRWTGMEMEDYEDVVGDIGKQRQIDFLERVMAGDWPDVEPRIEHENDGSVRIYKPKHVSKVAEFILLDVYSGKETKEGPSDPYKRWKKVDGIQRKLVERELGPMPIGDLSMVPRSKAIYYAGRDSDATIRLYPVLKKELERRKLVDLMNLKMKMLPAAIEIKMEGMLGEKRRFEELSTDMWNEMDKRRERLSSEFFGGQPINPGSSDQIATLMRRRGIKGAKKTKTGKMSTSKKSIEHFRFDDEAINLVEEWREHQKIRDSFCEPVLAEWPEGEEFTLVKTDLKITRVTSGRFSGSIIRGVPSAPLLAIPQRTEIGKRVRDCYVAEEGYVFGAWDLDQAEMRMIADESRDPAMVKLFVEGKRDIHTDTASKVFGKRYEDIENDKQLRKRLRDPAKRAGFGVATGITGTGLFDQLRMAGAVQENGEPWDVRSCEKLIKEWFKIFPGVKTYLEACKEECRRGGGWIYDRWRMPRPLPDIFSDDERLREEAGRQSHSHKIQGGAQGMLQRSMAWAYKELKVYGTAVKFTLQIHDELILKVARGLEEEIDKVMVEAMTQHGAKLIVPVKSSGGFAETWGGLK